MRQGKLMQAVVPVAAVLCGLGWAGRAEATTYNGNGGMGFGGQVGSSVLTVTDGGATINFSLATSGFGGNDLSIYLDTVAGGANSTAGYNDVGAPNGDVGRESLSGLNMSGTRTVATFAPGFGADYGISLEPGTFAGLFNLSTGSTSFGFVASAGLDTSATTTLNFSINKADVGLTMSSGSFTFDASLLSNTTYRSNETFGTSVTMPDPANTGTAPNAGFTGTTTFSDVDTFSYDETVSAPEPASLALFGVAGAGLLSRRRVRR